MARGANLFSGRAEDVIRVLLANYPKEWDLRSLAKEVGGSPSWTSEIVNSLITERLVLRPSRRARVRLASPFDLLRRWANARNFTARTKFIEFYSSEDDVARFLDGFKAGKQPEYALTALAGALKVAPHVRPTNVHAYVGSEEDAKKWAVLLKLMPIEENGNVKFAIAGDKGVFYGAREVDGVRVVSDVQLYVDLLNYPARGEEAAQAVLKVIEKKWK